MSRNFGVENCSDYDAGWQERYRRRRAGFLVRHAGHLLGLAAIVVIALWLR